MSFFRRFFQRKPTLPPPLPHDPRPDRETIYAEAFGPLEKVLHSFDPRPPHIDVYRYLPNAKRGHHTYITGEMSDQPQPKMRGKRMERTELVFYATSHNPLFSRLLRNAALCPFETGDPYEGFEVVPLQDRSQEVLGSDRFQHLWYCPGLRAEDISLCERLKVNGQAVYPMMIVPLTGPEHDLLASQGAEVLATHITASPVSIVYDPQRESVV